MNSEYEKELAFAKKMATDAGQIMSSNFGLSAKATWKADNTPLTETDTAVNQLVIDRIQEAFPEDGVLGEEASHAADRQRLWVVDPVDGTMTFTLGAPLSTFLLALVINGQPVLGIIYDPYLRRMFWAVKGHGAYMNGSLIRVSDADTIERGYFLINARMGVNPKISGKLFDAVGEQNGKPFNLLSFGYSSSLVPAGTAIGACLPSPHPWDVAAPKVIVEEAGGKVTDFQGNSRRYDKPGNGLLASNAKVHSQLLDILAGKA
jgi:fructose-1,6-bisphosphatase/inositol monophosphatase family enzyme